MEASRIYLLDLILIRPRFFFFFIVRVLTINKQRRRRLMLAHQFLHIYTIYSVYKISLYTRILIYYTNLLHELFREFRAFT